MNAAAGEGQGVAIGPSFRLPLGVTLTILSYLDGRGLSACAQVCLELYEATDFPGLWEVAAKAAFPHAVELGDVQSYTGEWKSLLLDQNHRNRSTLFEWEVVDCMTDTRRRYSPAFTLEDYTFQLIVDPNGNPYVPLARPGVSVYLTCVPTRHVTGVGDDGRLNIAMESMMPHEQQAALLQHEEEDEEAIGNIHNTNNTRHRPWECCVAFGLAVLNQTGARRDLHWNSNLLHDRFGPDCREWGVHRIVSLRRLREPANGYLSDAGSIKIQARLRLSYYSIKVFGASALQCHHGFGVADLTDIRHCRRMTSSSSLAATSARAADAVAAAKAARTAAAGAGAPRGGGLHDSVTSLTSMEVEQDMLLMKEEMGMEAGIIKEKDQKKKSSAPLPTRGKTTAASAGDEEDKKQGETQEKEKEDEEEEPLFRMYEVFQCMPTAHFQALLAQDLGLTSPAQLRLWTVTQPWADSPSAPRELLRLALPAGHPLIAHQQQQQQHLHGGQPQEQQYMTLGTALSAHQDGAGEVRIWAEVSGDGGLEAVPGQTKEGETSAEDGKGQEEAEQRRLNVEMAGEEENVEEEEEELFRSSTAAITRKKRKKGMAEQDSQSRYQYQGPDTAALRLVPTRPGQALSTTISLVPDPPDPLEIAEAAAVQAVEAAVAAAAAPAGLQQGEGDEGEEAEEDEGDDDDDVFTAAVAEENGQQQEQKDLTPVSLLFDEMAKLFSRVDDDLDKADPASLRLFVETPPTNWQEQRFPLPSSPASSPAIRTETEDIPDATGQQDHHQQEEQENEEQQQQPSSPPTTSCLGRCFARTPASPPSAPRALAKTDSYTVKDLKVENGQVLCLFPAGHEEDIKAVYHQLATDLLRQAAAVYSKTGSVAKVEALPCPVSVMQGTVRPQGSRLRPRLTFSPVVDLFERLGNQRFRIRNTFLERQHESARETLEYSITGKHLGFCCDRCGATDFSGPRYKCSVCNDYDLCQDCRVLPVERHRYRFGGRRWDKEDFNEHTDEHVLVVIPPMPHDLALLRQYV